MDPTHLLRPAEYVWHPTADAGLPEPDPAGPRVLSLLLGRAHEAGEISRIVLVETTDGFEPLQRRIQLHGDEDEGWDWGWRGSAPLETALNALLYFIHPRAAWRLQWAFCETFLHRLPPCGGVLEGNGIRDWIHANWWIGRHTSWAEAEQSAPERVLAVERTKSRTLSPRARAALTAAFIRQGETGFQRAAAVLAGSPAEQRWATLAILAAVGPPPGSSVHTTWCREASPITPGLPDPASLREINAVWSRLVGRKAVERAGILAACIREASGDGVGWTAIPLLRVSLGAGFRRGTSEEAHLVGDPVAIAGTATALARSLARDDALARDACDLGLSTDTLREVVCTAHAVHVTALRDERRAIEQQAAEDGERVLAAERARLPRGRSPRPPPSSGELRQWLLAAPLDLVAELARAAGGPAGPLTLRAALQRAGLAFPDPAGTITQTVAWYLEERAPAVLDTPTFLVRTDGMVQQDSPR